MKPLQKVKITKQDSCYTYSLKRVGLASHENLYMTAEQFLKNSELEHGIKEKDLNVGDILVYIKDKEECDKVRVSNIITEHREILSDYFYYNLHFMVYEGNGLISEVVYEEGVPMIIMMKLCDVKDNYYRVLVNN